MKKQDNPRGQRGSAILWIFILIGLVAALGLALNRGSRMGQESLGTEQTYLAATEILSYGAALRNAVRQLQINGCADTEISFEHPATGNDYENGNAPSDESCHVLRPDGGAMNWVDPSSLLSDTSYLITGAMCIPEIGTGDSCSDASEAELALILPLSRLEVCDAINNDVNITSTPDDIQDAIYSTKFTGTYTAAMMPEGTSGYMQGCFLSGGDPYFYQVLIAR